MDRVDRVAGNRVRVGDRVRGIWVAALTCHSPSLWDGHSLNTLMFGMYSQL